jgi:hypothetical protein
MLPNKLYVYLFCGEITAPIERPYVVVISNIYVQEFLLQIVQFFMCNSTE